MRFSILLAGLLPCLAWAAAPKQQAMQLFDSHRQREIALETYLPSATAACLATKNCPVALISPGYRVSHTAYSFIAQFLNQRGYFVASIAHDLPSDLALQTEGNIYANRLPLWARGAENLRFVKQELAAKYPQFAWQNLLLIGASNGGDISTLFAHQRPDMVSAVITLDHRRLALPRTNQPRILSIRASDFEADDGVLPNAKEQAQFGIQIEKIAGAKHNDMQDAGSAELKQKILSIMQQFLDAKPK